jgi:glutathione S-transferase
VLPQVKDAAGTVRIIAESAAIMTYICLAHGAGTGLQTSCNDDTVRVTEVCSLMYDLGDRFMATMHMLTDHDKQLQARQELLKTVIPRVFDGLEHRLQPSGYVVDSSITAADIMLHQTCKWLTGGKVEGIPSNCLDAYSTVRKCVQNVDNHPKVKEYYAK